MEELVEKMKAQSRFAVQRNRQLLLESQGRSVAQTYEAEATLIKTAAGTKDGGEGVAAFVDKRPPKFTS
jgi:enoyl-CoA hydratase/carnithine racemase